MKALYTIIALLAVLSITCVVHAQGDDRVSRDDAAVTAEGTTPGTDAEQDRGRKQEPVRKQADDKKAVKKARPETKAPEKKAEVRAVDKKADTTAKKEGDPSAAERETAGEEVAGLLTISDEEIRYNRIPGITIKSVKDKSDGFVSVGDEQKTGADGKKSDTGGLFGLGKERTKSVAGWGLLILIFILFFVYMQTRARRQGKRVVRTIHKK